MPFKSDAQRKAAFAKKAPATRAKPRSTPPVDPLKAPPSKAAIELVANYADFGSSAHALENAGRVLESLNGWLDAKRGRIGREALIAEIEAVRESMGRATQDLASLTRRVEAAAKRNWTRKGLR